MQVRFLGSGDAFGSGGRFNTCFHVTAEAATFLVDCGASSMIALRRFGIDPNGIRTVFLTHLHGDHFAGLPFLILDAQLYSRRTEPLTVAGPPGTRERLTQVMEVLFPGSAGAARRFEVAVVELEPARRETITGVAVTPYIVNGVSVTPFQVDHACGAPPFALRLECDGKVLAYTGDTAWTDALIDCGRDADLLIAEALFFDKRIKWHLDYASLREHLDEIRPRRLILTHMGPDMLAHRGEADCETAEDGMIVQV